MSDFLNQLSELNSEALQEIHRLHGRLSVSSDDSDTDSVSSFSKYSHLKPPPYSHQELQENLIIIEAPIKEIPNEAATKAPLEKNTIGSKIEALLKKEHEESNTTNIVYNSLKMENYKSPQELTKAFSLLMQKCYCFICEKNCSDFFSGHYVSAAHYKKIERWLNSKIKNIDVKEPVDIRTFFCKICNLPLPGDHTAWRHYEEVGHLKRSNTFCESCLRVVPVSDMLIHIQSAKHLAKVEDNNKTGTSVIVESSQHISKQNLKTTKKAQDVLFPKSLSGIQENNMSSKQPIEKADSITYANILKSNKTDTQDSQESNFTDTGNKQETLVSQMSNIQVSQIMEKLKYHLTPTYCFICDKKQVDAFFDHYSAETHNRKVKYWLTSELNREKISVNLNWLYCEVCNLVLCGIALAEEHYNSEEHLRNLNTFCEVCHRKVEDMVKHIKLNMHKERVKRNLRTCIEDPNSLANVSKCVNGGEDLPNTQNSYVRKVQMDVLKVSLILTNLTKNLALTYCHICNKNQVDAYFDHYSSETHNSKVKSWLTNELNREKVSVNLNELYCEVCNTVLSGTALALKHYKSEGHLRKLATFCEVCHRKVEHMVAHSKDKMHKKRVKSQLTDFEVLDCSKSINNAAQSKGNVTLLEFSPEICQNTGNSSMESSITEVQMHDSKVSLILANLTENLSLTYCHICNKYQVDAYFDDHYSSETHNSKVASWLTNKLNREKVSVNLKWLYCEVCNTVLCGTALALKHYKGEDHLRKLATFCEVCHRKVKNMVAHSKDKTHKKRVKTQLLTGFEILNCSKNINNPAESKSKITLLDYLPEIHQNTGNSSMESSIREEPVEGDMLSIRTKLLEFLAETYCFICNKAADIINQHYCTGQHGRNVILWLNKQLEINKVSVDPKLIYCEWCNLVLCGSQLALHHYKLNYHLNALFLFCKKCDFRYIHKCPRHCSGLNISVTDQTLPTSSALIDILIQLEDLLSPDYCYLCSKFQTVSYYTHYNAYPHLKKVENWLQNQLHHAKISVNLKQIFCKACNLVLDLKAQNHYQEINHIENILTFCEICESKIEDMQKHYDSKRHKILLAKIDIHDVSNKENEEYQSNEISEKEDENMTKDSDSNNHKNLLAEMNRADRPNQKNEECQSNEISERKAETNDYKKLLVEIDIFDINENNVKHQNSEETIQSNIVFENLKSNYDGHNFADNLYIEPQEKSCDNGVNTKEEANLVYGNEESTSTDRTQSNIYHFQAQLQSLVEKEQHLHQEQLDINLCDQVNAELTKIIEKIYLSQTVPLELSLKCLKQFNEDLEGMYRETNKLTDEANKDTESKSARSTEAVKKEIGTNTEKVSFDSEKIDDVNENETDNFTENTIDHCTAAKLSMGIDLMKKMLNRYVCDVDLALEYVRSFHNFIRDGVQGSFVLLDLDESSLNNLTCYSTTAECFQYEIENLCKTLYDRTKMSLDVAVDYITQFVTQLKGLLIWFEKKDMSMWINEDYGLFLNEGLSDSCESIFENTMPTKKNGQNQASCVLN